MKRAVWGWLILAEGHVSFVYLPAVVCHVYSQAWPRDSMHAPCNPQTKPWWPCATVCMHGLEVVYNDAVMLPLFVRV